MPSQVDVLLRALRERADEICSWSQEVVDQAHSLCDPATNDMAEWCWNDWAESLCTAESGAGSIESVFDEVVGALAPPNIIMARELKRQIDAYHQNYCAVDRERYEHFLDHVEYRLLGDRESELLPICNVRGLPESEAVARERTLWFTLGDAIARYEIVGTTPDPNVVSNSKSADAESEAENARGVSLWNANGVTLEIDCIEVKSRTGHFRAPDPNSGDVLARLRGRISPEGMTALERELVPILRANLRSVALLTGSGFGDSAMPSFQFEDLTQYLPFVRGCTQTIFIIGGKKDSMDRRFANAQRLLAESDGQQSSAIRLALSVTALESLLGRKGQEISTPLAQNIAALLEAEFPKRSRAADFVKHLYDRRSRVLHGESLVEQDKNAATARQLAAAVLYTLWFRCDFKRRMGERPDSPDDLLAELRDRNWEGGLAIGIPDVPAVRALWSA